MVHCRCDKCQSEFYSQSVYNDHMEAHNLENVESPVMVYEEESKERSKTPHFAIHLDSDEENP